VSYFATGEGVTVYVAVADRSSTCRRILEERIPDYFRAGIVTVPIDSSNDAEARGIVAAIPVVVLETLAATARGSGYYFSELHYNQS